MGYQLCLYAMYVLTSRFLLASDATLFNLSMLTSDVYSVLFAWKVEGQHLSRTYAAAFAATMSGVVIYNAQPATVVEVGKRPQGSALGALVAGRSGGRPWGESKAAAARKLCVEPRLGARKWRRPDASVADFGD